MNSDKINAIFARFARANPQPKTELKYTNEYTLLVAVILSAQATDVGVNKATPALFKIANSPKKMLVLGEGGLKKYIKTIGLFNAKAKNIIGMSQALLEKHGGKIPHSFGELCELPGVGRKTANVWLNCALGKPLIAVDTHVFRTANRIGLTKAKNPLESERQLEKKIPEKWKIHAHHWLILHGRYTCIARKPKCRECLIVDLCEYKDKNLLSS